MFNKNEHQHQGERRTKHRGEHNHAHNHHHSEHRHQGEHEGRHHQKRGGRHAARLLRHGDLQLLVLTTIAQGAGYGYEIIKSIAAASSNFYEPSPGVIYPNLSFLEEQNLIASQITQGNKRSYQITQEGQNHLKQHHEETQRILSTLKEAKNAQKNSKFSEELEQAIHRFKVLLRHKLLTNELPHEKVLLIANIINEATTKIEEVNTLLTDQK